MWFEWDEHRAAANERKHGVTFEEAATCFYDPLQVAYYDPDHSEDEDREILIAGSDQDRLLWSSMPSVARRSGSSRHGC